MTNSRVLLRCELVTYVIHCHASVPKHQHRELGLSKLPASSIDFEHASLVQLLVTRDRISFHSHLQAHVEALIGGSMRVGATPLPERRG